MGLFPRPRPHRRGAQEDHEGLGGVSLLRIGIVIVRQAPLTRSGAQSRAKSPRKCRDAVSGAWRTTAPRRGVFWRMAASLVGPDESSSARKSVRVGKSGSVRGETRWRSFVKKKI